MVLHAHLNTESWSRQWCYVLNKSHTNMQRSMYSTTYGHRYIHTLKGANIHFQDILQNHCKVIAIVIEQLILMEWQHIVKTTTSASTRIWNAQRYFMLIWTVMIIWIVWFKKDSTPSQWCLNHRSSDFYGEQTAMSTNVPSLLSKHIRHYVLQNFNMLNF